MKHETAKYVRKYLTDTIFETGAYRVPSKSQKATGLGQEGPYFSQTTLTQNDLVLGITWDFLYTSFKNSVC